jgi:peptide chain release factor subunit 1
MITVQDLERLLAWEPRANSPVLSVYLVTDLSKPANLRRGFEAVLEQMLKSVEAQLAETSVRERFAEDAARVRRFVTDHKPMEKSLVIFCDASEDFFWPRGLQLALQNDARWDSRPYLRPLLEALDEHERYGVVLTEHGRSRLFTVFMGDIAEHVDALSPTKIRHLRETGTDHIESEKQFQQKAETYAHRHLKHVAQLLDRLSAQYGFDRLIIAGPEEATTELARLLPKRLRNRVVARVALPFSAAAEQVLKATEEVIERVERETERRLVEDLIEEAGARRHAVTGLEPTLLALQEGRVYRLVYADGFRRAGGQCQRCAALHAEGASVCQYCGGALTHIDDLIDTMAQRVTASGGKVEVVRGEAARRLASVGSIGAQLRF